MQFSGCFTTRYSFPVPATPKKTIPFASFPFPVNLSIIASAPTSAISGNPVVRDVSMPFPSDLDQVSVVRDVSVPFPSDLDQVSVVTLLPRDVSSPFWTHWPVLDASCSFQGVPKSFSPVPFVTSETKLTFSRNSSL